ncbi:MAG TPA: fused MFS/spermidine synthase [Caulobacteraceae bacterium]|jgi:SAM-dependent methyltransferase
MVLASSVQQQDTRVKAAAPSALYAMAVFASAGLVFLVEPMIARMVLPRLGGSSAVWNTSLVFFQAALLAGYAYAHALQRLTSLKAQMAAHIAVLAVAALTLPLRISEVFGPPSIDHPAFWLLGVLLVSVGPAFAALSATAPLLQAWYARLSPVAAGGADPYRLYAASNLGSLLALVAYPVLVEPLMRLKLQGVAWSIGYGLFVLVVFAVAVLSRRAQASQAKEAQADGQELPPLAATPPVVLTERLVWIGLSAATSSLLLGVTAHITQDVASAPFLWVIPLALYLLSFVIAFQAKPLIRPGIALWLQAALAPLAAALYSLLQAPWLYQLGVNLGAFFFTALVCHHALAHRRPAPARLTDFYLAMSLGGVIGGAFNAFVAPVIFNAVWEYPIVLGLACLARPWGRGRLDHWGIGALVSAVLTIGALMVPQLTSLSAIVILLTVAGGMTFLLRRRGLIYGVLILALGVASYDQLFKGKRQTYRSFFGEVQLVRVPAPIYGVVKIMVHGSTLHGAQAERPGQRCIPTTYYGPGTPIATTIRTVQALHPAMRMGAVGLGTGTVAAFTRPADTLQFFEIDPLIVRIAFDPTKFSFVKGCAKGRVSVTLGDARQSLEKVADHSYDLLLVDAFSSDSVPTHLLTAEAMRTYLRVIKPDGVVLLHLSNRNLELEGPAAASVRLAGGAPVQQDYFTSAPSVYVESGAQAILVGRDRKSLRPFIARSDWVPAVIEARPWTDDYVNVFGALIARIRRPR